MLPVGRIEILYPGQRLLDKCFNPFLLGIEKTDFSGCFIRHFRGQPQIITEYALIMTGNIADQLFHFSYILPAYSHVRPYGFQRRYPVRRLIRKNINGALDIRKLVIQEACFLPAGKLQYFIGIFFLGTGGKP